MNKNGLLAPYIEGPFLPFRVVVVPVFPPGGVLSASPGSFYRITAGLCRPTGKNHDRTQPRLRGFLRANRRKYLCSCGRERHARCATTGGLQGSADHGSTAAGSAILRTFQTSLPPSPKLRRTSRGIKDRPRCGARPRRCRSPLRGFFFAGKFNPLATEATWIFGRD